MFLQNEIYDERNHICGGIEGFEIGRESERMKLMKLFHDLALRFFCFYNSWPISSLPLRVSIRKYNIIKAYSITRYVRRSVSGSDGHAFFFSVFMGGFCITAPTEGLG